MINEKKFIQLFANELLKKRVNGEYEMRLLTRAIGIDKQSVYNWEDGVNPLFYKAAQVARYLKIDINKLLDQCEIDG